MAKRKRVQRVKRVKAVRPVRPARPVRRSASEPEPEMNEVTPLIQDRTENEIQEQETGQMNEPQSEPETEQTDFEYMEYADKKKKKKGGLLKKAGMYVTLKPFMPVMRIALKRKGIKTKGMKLGEVTQLFYTKFVQKKPEQIKGNKPKTNFEIAFAENIDSFEKENFAVASTAVVSIVVKFIKAMAQKKKEGKPLTKEEQEIDKAITEVKRDEAKSQPLGIYTPYIIGAGIVSLILLVLWFALKKK